MKRIAITGVSGYIGTRLLSRLETLDTVQRIVGVDIQAPKGSSSKLMFYRQDILQPFSRIFTESEVDSAIHLAFVLMPSHDWQATHRINIDGTLNFLEACRNSQVKHIIFLSSHTVYGAHADNALPLTENSPLRPLRRFQYSWDKAETDRMFQDFAASNQDICVTILRACVVMGPTADNAITRSLFKPVIISVAGHNPAMQFLHEDDLVEVILTFLSQRRPGIFNIAGEGTIPYHDLATLSGRRLIAVPAGLLHLVMDFSWRLHLQNESASEGLSFIKYPVVISTEKVKRETGFQFRYASLDTVMSFIAAKKQQGNLSSHGWA